MDLILTIAGPLLNTGPRGSQSPVVLPKLKGASTQSFANFAPIFPIVVVPIIFYELWKIEGYAIVHLRAEKLSYSQ